MQRLAAAAALMSLASLAHAQAPVDCGALAAPQAVQAATAIAPVAGELGLPEQPLGVGGGVLAEAAVDALSAEQVLYRQQLEGCAQVAGAIPPPSGTMEAPSLTGAPADAQAAVAADAAVVDMAIAATAPASAPGPELIDAATYKPRTECDNTPWRLNTNQNGERMTADAFAAWMEAKGVRVAKGRAPVAAAEGEAAAGDPLPQAPEAGIEEGGEAE